MRPPLRSEFRMSGRVLMLAAAAFALVIGFGAGAWVIGPKFADEAAEEAAAARRAERFGPRTVDLSRDYPEPFAYRTATPAFPVSGAPYDAAAARERAREAFAARDRLADPLPFDTGDVFAPGPVTEAPRPPVDRHTGVVY